METELITRLCKDEHGCYRMWQIPYRGGEVDLEKQGPRPVDLRADNLRDMQIILNDLREAMEKPVLRLHLKTKMEWINYGEMNG